MLYIFYLASQNQKTMENIFDQNVSNKIIDRINQLQPETKASWGKMNVAQMLAHCNVTYEMVYENIHPKPGFFTRLMLRLFVKSSVVNDKPYKQNAQTAPQFIIKEEKDFAKEKARLVTYIKRVQKEGVAVFEGKESHSFGPLSATEWNNLFYKHIDHHLRQFGV